MNVKYWLGATACAAAPWVQGWFILWRKDRRNPGLMHPAGNRNSWLRRNVVERNKP